MPKIKNIISTATRFIDHIDGLENDNARFNALTVTSPNYSQGQPECCQALKSHLSTLCELMADAKKMKELASNPQQLQVFYKVYLRLSAAREYQHQEAFVRYTRVIQPCAETDVVAYVALSDEVATKYAPLAPLFSRTSWTVSGMVTKPTKIVTRYLALCDRAANPLAAAIMRHCLVNHLQFSNAILDSVLNQVIDPNVDLWQKNGLQLKDTIIQAINDYAVAAKQSAPQAFSDLLSTIFISIAEISHTYINWSDIPGIEFAEKMMKNPSTLFGDKPSGDPALALLKLKGRQKQHCQQKTARLTGGEEELPYVRYDVLYTSCRTQWDEATQQSFVAMICGDDTLPLPTTVNFHLLRRLIYLIETGVLQDPVVIAKRVLALMTDSTFSRVLSCEIGDAASSLLSDAEIDAYLRGDFEVGKDALYQRISMGTVEMLLTDASISKYSKTQHVHLAYQLSLSAPLQKMMAHGVHHVGKQLLLRLLSTTGHGLQEKQKYALYEDILHERIDFDFNIEDGDVLTVIFDAVCHRYREQKPFTRTDICGWLAQQIARSDKPLQQAKLSGPIFQRLVDEVTQEGKNLFEFMCVLENDPINNVLCAIAQETWTHVVPMHQLWRQYEKASGTARALINPRLAAFSTGYVDGSVGAFLYQMMVTADEHGTDDNASVVASAPVGNSSTANNPASSADTDLGFDADAILQLLNVAPQQSEMNSFAANFSMMRKNSRDLSMIFQLKFDELTRPQAQLLKTKLPSLLAEKAYHSVDSFLRDVMLIILDAKQSVPVSPYFNTILLRHVDAFCMIGDDASNGQLVDAACQLQPMKVLRDYSTTAKMQALPTIHTLMAMNIVSFGSYQSQPIAVEKMLTQMVDDPFLVTFMQFLNLFRLPKSGLPQACLYALQDVKNGKLAPALLPYQWLGQHVPEEHMFSQSAMDLMLMNMESLRELVVADEALKTHAPFQLMRLCLIDILSPEFEALVSVCDQLDALITKVASRKSTTLFGLGESTSQKAIEVNLKCLKQNVMSSMKTTQINGLNATSILNNVIMVLNKAEQNARLYTQKSFGRVVDSYHVKPAFQAMIAAIHDALPTRPLPEVRNHSKQQQ